MGRKNHSIRFEPNLVKYCPPNVRRNFSGFLVRKEAVIAKVDPQKLLLRIAILGEQLLIASLQGPKPNPINFEIQIQMLNKELKGNSLSFCKNVGKGFFLLNSTDHEMLRKALMLSLFKSKWGTCLLQAGSQDLTHITLMILLSRHG